MKGIFAVVLKVLALTVALFVCFAIGASILGQQGAQTSQEAAQAATALIVMCLLDAIVLTHLILRSRWSGWRLMTAVLFVFYGVMTFMGQIESAVFITRLPAGMLPRLFLMGAAITAPFAVLAVLILGKGKSRAEASEASSRLVMPASEWAWRLAVIAVAYVTVYFTFGYYIAWQSPDVRAYYGGSDPGSFLAQMGTVLRDTPWLVPFQILRSMLWAAIALPVVRMMKGPWQETALSLAALFSIVMNAQLLLPNPYMPEPVRMAHMLETATSNLIFGFLVGWLLTRRAPLASVPGRVAERAAI